MQLCPRMLLPHPLRPHRPLLQVLPPGRRLLHQLQKRQPLLQVLHLVRRLLHQLRKRQPLLQVLHLGLKLLHQLRQHLPLLQALPLGQRLLYQLRTRQPLLLLRVLLLNRRYLRQLRPHRQLLLLHMHPLNRRLLHPLLHGHRALHLLDRQRLLHLRLDVQQVTRLPVVGLRRLRHLPLAKLLPLHRFHSLQIHLHLDHAGSCPSTMGLRRGGRCPGRTRLGTKVLLGRLRDWRRPVLVGRFLRRRSSREGWARRQGVQEQSARAGCCPETI